MRPLSRLKRGKSQGRPASVNAATGQNGHLLHVTDEIEGTKWLVDGGALVSIVPPTKAQRRLGTNGTQLCAANGTKIDCYGKIRKSLVIGERRFDFDVTIDTLDTISGRRERASATMLAFPSKYRMSVVNSEMHES